MVVDSGDTDQGVQVERFVGKAVLVTGAASGIGAATAARLVSEGAAVVGADVNEPAAPEAGPGGGSFVGVVADVTDDDAVAAAVARTASLTGRLDGVFHAAGVAGGGPVHLLDPEEWRRIIDVNLMGTYLVCRHALRQMLGQDLVDGERGALVNVASIEGIEGTAGGGAYNASKGGVVLLTKNMAIDYGRQGIRVNAVCPGFIDTPMMSSVMEMPGMEDIQASFIDEHALRRRGRPEEIAAAAAFLLTSDASFITGHAMVVDGGYTAGRDHGVTSMMGL